MGIQLADSVDLISIGVCRHVWTFESTGILENTLQIGALST